MSNPETGPAKTPDDDSPISGGLIQLIILGLVGWGIYLALGATGYFTQKSLFDIRKSFIVFVSVGLFLGLWFLVLRRRRNRPAISDLAEQDRSDDTVAPTDEPAQSRAPLSVAGITTLLLTAAGMTLWVVAIMTFDEVSRVTTTIMGWIAALLIFGVATSSIIALSQPGPRRGKSLGFVGLLVFLASIFGFIVRMTP